MQEKSLAELTDQELVEEEKKRKKSYTYMAFFVGFMLGVSFWAATHGGKFWVTIFPLVLIYFAKNKHNDHQDIKKEIEARKKN